MNLYLELSKKPIFRIEDVNYYYNNINSARSAVGRLLSNGLILKIRNDMYTCVNGMTGEPVASRYQIASSITNTAYISHHTAMEYYGYSDQIYYEVYVSSETAFRDFEFDGYYYRFRKTEFCSGVDSPEYSGGIKISNYERTLVDCVKDMDKISGVEEVVNCVKRMTSINEEKLLLYLDMYDNQFLYQKVGYLLQNLSPGVPLSDEFFAICKNKIGKSKRYFTSDSKSGVYNAEWKLVIPNSILGISNGVSEDAV